MTSTRIAAAAALSLALACGGSTTPSTDPCQGVSCPAGEVCDLSTGACQTVDAGAGCTSDSQCSPGVCDSATRQCVTSECSPACPAWETCSGRTCALNSGACNSASDCPASAPLCTSNACTAPAVTQPAAPHYRAVMITSQAYQAQFEQIALMHTLTGVPTYVNTVEAICAAAPGGCSTTNACNDAPKAIKDYIIAQHASGVTQVVLGGDGTIVPSRQTEAKYSNPLYPPPFDETFYSDDYYGDLTNWDTNGDCVYGDEANDTPGYVPAIGISRISFSSAAELSAYVAKETAYLTAYDTSRIGTALFMSNVATDITIPVINDTVPIDSALYFEYPGRTLSFIPADFQVTKLYATASYPDAGVLTVPAEISAFEAGANLVVHSGHGDEEDVTVEQDGSNEFSGQDAYVLQNAQYPVMISCACEAATFMDGDGCAGQNFITAPHGGGVGYLGNSTIGLGIAGGMQLLDQFVKYSFSQSNPIIGDAIVAAHVNMPTSDALTFNLPVVGNVSYSVVDPTSWTWTQKAVTYLGDGLLPIYTDVATSAAPAFTASKSALGNFTTITFAASAVASGTLAVAIGNDVYELPLAGLSAAPAITVQGPVTSLTLGYSAAGSLAAYQTVSLP